MKNTGARGLRALLESILTEAMFEVLQLPERLFSYYITLALTILFHLFYQIPDAKKGDERIDAVIVDEESIGAEASRGCTATILRGDGAFERYLSENRSKDTTESTV